MVGETRPNSIMPVSFVAGETSAGEHARKARHTVVTRLVTDMCYIAPNTFVACITYVSYIHCTCKVSYYVITSFDFVVE